MYIFIELIFQIVMEKVFWTGLISLIQKIMENIVNWLDICYNIIQNEWYERNAFPLALERAASILYCLIEEIPLEFPLLNKTLRGMHTLCRGRLLSQLHNGAQSGSSPSWVRETGSPSGLVRFVLKYNPKARVGAITE